MARTRAWSYDTSEDLYRLAPTEYPVRIRYACAHAIEQMATSEENEARLRECAAGELCPYCAPICPCCDEVLSEDWILAVAQSLVRLHIRVAQ